MSMLIWNHGNVHCEQVPGCLPWSQNLANLLNWSSLNSIQIYPIISNWIWTWFVHLKPPKQALHSLFDLQIQMCLLLVSDLTNFICLLFIVLQHDASHWIIHRTLWWVTLIQKFLWREHQSWSIFRSTFQWSNGVHSLGQYSEVRLPIWSTGMLAIQDDRGEVEEDNWSCYPVWAEAWEWLVLYDWWVCSVTHHWEWSLLQ